MKKTLALIFGLLAVTAGANAQAAAGTDKSQQIVTERVVVGDHTGSKPIVLLNEMNGLGKVVKGAPYTATAVTETTQTLADGNRIVNKTTALLARDSEGRMRREEHIAKVGNLQANTSEAVMISDPVGDTEYMIQPRNASPDETVIISNEGGKENKLIHRKIERLENREQLRAVTNALVLNKTGLLPENFDEPGISGNVKHESLGTQVIEGVSADGVRNTRTIPAGAIGNEKPIVITSEVWTSPELQVVVLSKRNDPRFGETVYKLTEITRGEPDPALFQLPERVKKDAK